MGAAKRKVLTISIHKKTLAIALVIVTVIILSAMPQRGMADTETSIGDDSVWPTNSVAGQTQYIYIKINPALSPPYVYRNCTLYITDPNGDLVTPQTTDSNSDGWAGFIFTPTIVGLYSLQFYFPGQWLGIDSSWYTSLLSEIQDWDVSAPLSISVSPSTLNTVVGASGTFTPEASGGVPPYLWYYWYEIHDPYSFELIGTDTNPTPLTVVRSTAGNYSFYCVVLDSDYYNATSNNVTLIVSTPLNVVASPETLSVAIDQPSTFTAAVSGGTPPYTYLWYEESTIIGTDATLEISKSDAGTYSFYCRVTDDNELEATSNNVELVVNSGLAVSVDPSRVSREVDESGTFTATASGGTPPYTYQWLEGSTIIGTDATLEISKSDAGTYSFYCRVTDDNELEATSNNVELVVNSGLAGGIPIEYIAVPATVIATASAAAIVWSRFKPHPKGRGEEAAKLPIPLLSKLRWIQAQVHELPSGGKEKIRRTNALRADTLHTLDMRIGPADKGWLTPPEESSFPEEKLTWKDGVSHLQAVFSEPNHSPEPQTREIVMPREGPSTTCQFSFTPKGEVPNFKGRIIVLHGNQVLQTAMLEGKVVPNPDQHRGLKLQLGVESIIEPDLAHLDSHPGFDLAFMTNHTPDNSPTVITIANEQAFFNRPEKVELPIKEITRLIENVVTYPEKYPKSMADPTNESWLLKLAFKGRELYEGIVVDQIGEERLKSVNRIQLVSTIEGYLPLEFLYDMPNPKFDAKLCTKWKEALGKSAEELDEGLCKGCTLKKSLAPADTLCLLGFWGLRLIIERHYIDPYNKPDLKGYAFALRGESTERRRPLKVLKSAIFAASNKVDAEVPQSQKVFNALQDVTHQKTAQVTNLKSWKNEVKKLQPSLLVLLTHISPCSINPEESQMEIGKGVALPKAYINREYLLPSEDAQRPVVLLLGCTTLCTDAAFRGFAAKFRREGAAIVLSTITDVLGRHVAPVSADIVHDLEQAAKNDLSMGDTLLLVRKKALADGTPMVLSLVGIGDADWRFETSEAN